MACRMISSCVCCCPSSGKSCRSFSTSGISMSASVSNSEKVTSCCCCGGGLVAATTVSGLTPISVVVVGGDVSWLAMVIIYDYDVGRLFVGLFPQRTTNLAEVRLPTRLIHYVFQLELGGWERPVRPEDLSSHWSAPKSCRYGIKRLQERCRHTHGCICCWVHLTFHTWHIIHSPTAVHLAVTTVHHPVLRRNVLLTYWRPEGLVSYNLP